MNMVRWLMRARLWVARPPSPARIKLVFGIIGVGLILAGIEWIWGWPDFLTVNPPQRIR